MGIVCNTAKGTKVCVTFDYDVEPNLGGYYCVVYDEFCMYELDNFCIHKEDCDCSYMRDVENYAKEYISKVVEY